MDNVDQKSNEWHALRCGKFTGSRFNDVMAVSKRDGKPLKARESLIWEIVTERIQGYQPQGASSQAMQWGNDNEDLAREAYEFKTGEFVDEIAFINHDDVLCSGVSPDGLIGDDGGIEIKCPKNPSVHMQRFLYGVPDEYMPQIQGSLWVTGRKWWDFVSYDPDTAEEFKLLIIRVERDEDYIKKLQENVIQCNEDAEKLINELRGKLK